MRRQGMLNGSVCWCLALLLTATGGRWLAAADRVAEPVSLTEQIPPWPVGPFVILRGGGVLAGRLRELSADRVTIDTVSCGTLDLPRAAVVGYRSSPRVGPQIDAVGHIRPNEFHEQVLCAAEELFVTPQRVVGVEGHNLDL